LVDDSDTLSLLLSLELLTLIKLEFVDNWIEIFEELFSLDATNKVSISSLVSAILEFVTDN
ncbi:25187_t:CDS:2, partial [Racocetra persica]